MCRTKELAEILQMLSKLSVDDKMQLLNFLYDLQDSGDSSMPLSSAQQKD